MDNGLTPYVNSVFEQPWFLDIVAKDHWDEIILEENDEIIARFPYVFSKNSIFMPKLTQTLGPWIKLEYREKLVGNTQLSKQKEIVNSFFEKLKDFKHIKITLHCNNTYVLPYRWNNCFIEPSFSYQIKDLSNIDEIYNNFNKTVKKNIRSALNKNLSIEYSYDSEIIIKLLDKTFEKQKRKKNSSNELIKNLVASACSRNSGVIIYAKDNLHNIYSGAFLLYDENCCYYLIGGNDYSFKSIGAQDFVLWKSIKFASKVSKIFDFEGSMIEGIENFFKKFGGETCINYRIKKQSIIDDVKDIIKPRIKKMINYKN